MTVKKSPGSIDELEAFANEGIEYKEVTVKPGAPTLWIGSLTAGDIIEWQEESASADAKKKREAGIQLLVKSLVTPDEPHVRYADDASQVERVTKIAKKLPHSQYEKVVAAVLELNGYDVKKPVEAAKNV